MKKFSVAVIVLMLVAVLTAGCTAAPPAAPMPAPTPSPTTQPPIPRPSTGTIKVLVTDAPGDVSEVNVTVSEVEVHKAGGDGESGKWITLDIANEGQPFNLLALQDGLTMLLAEGNEVEPGKYTQLRMTVFNVIVKTDDGPEDGYQAIVPSDKLKFVRPFNLEAGETITLIADFDAAKSVIFPGGKKGNVKKVIFKPVVKLSIQKEGKPEVASLTLEPEEALNALPDDNEHELTVTLLDQKGEPMPEKDISLAITGVGNFKDMEEPYMVTTGEDGTATFTISSDEAGESIITATFEDDGNTLIGTATKEWYYPEVSELELEPESAVNQLPGDTTETFTVTVTDQNGIGMPDQVVSISTDFGTLSDTSVTTGSDGTATFTISSSDGGTATITAQLGDLSDTATKEWITD